MSEDVWLADWLDPVAAGQATMTQRAVSRLAAHGGTDAAVAAARARGVHLVRLTDDHGRELVAASRTPFVTLC